MDCDTIREAISAGLDGEPAQSDARAVDQHLARCPACRAWADAAAVLHRQVRVAPAVDVPDLTASILAATRPDPVEERLRLARWGLALVAIVQLAAAVPMLLAGDGSTTSLHVAREMGSWDVALAVGFLFAAWRPQRAGGMVPLVGALVVCLAITATLDLASGGAEIDGEVIHLLDVTGFALLWVVARVRSGSVAHGLRLA